MRPVLLSSALVRLDQLRPGDAPLMVEYCQDELMPRYLARLPRPYRIEDATGFISGYAPAAWDSDRECTWAVRSPTGPDLLGVISLSLPASSVPDASAPDAAAPAAAATASSVPTAADRTSSIGFWLGAPHRGRGLIVEAQRLVLDWAFERGLCDAVRWECVAGNLGSARAARKAGFRYTGHGPAGAADRNGTHPMKWHGILNATDVRTPPAGWPTEVVGA